MTKEMNRTAGVVVAEMLAMPIQHHFESKYTVREVVDELLRQNNDVLVTMRELARRCSSNCESVVVGPSSTTTTTMWKADSDLVLAIRWHFDNKFDGDHIVHSLTETNGDILNAMRNLRAEADLLPVPQTPRPKL